ncbi:biotin--[acetyl-CoA-carboxylase] ligase [Mucisphaera calidilacus]|uniref:Bifunctional ligase/repressor BirA n=1 Tax=Mucisphaera calidilacus TaxID=2527982 RepID=A0A518C0Q0_9BACT|nr:biotin--[acetyl-CoA-carboxylase] ligase [Mucisphaera calidilacus]QDU72796.1 Bifunctional ligase/repressor BirA [Mucisphaera calidilacus]
MLVIWHEQVGSTNDRAAELAEEGHASPFVVAARRQSGGRGRGGRSWVSPEGGAWLSVAWRAEDGWPGWGLASLAVGVAVRGVVLGVLGDAGVSVAIKWPNDVLIGGRKVCGVLCERPWAGRAGGDWLIAGVGLNVNVDVSSLGDGLRVPAVSLDEVAGRRLDVDALVERLGGAIVERLEGLGASGGSDRLLGAVGSSLAWLGASVRVTCGGSDRAGRLVGVDEQGHLVLEAGGVRESFCAGDVTCVRMDDAALASSVTCLKGS